MLQIFQEEGLLKLTETSLYEMFNKTSGITKDIISEISNNTETIVTPDSITEITSLIRLNGDPIARKAVDEYKKGNIIIIHNKATSKIPPSLPYVIMKYKGKPTAFVFADKFVNRITAPNEYTNLMAMLEAAYLALTLFNNPNAFLMNSPLMLTLCNIYTLMASCPLEQRLYVKGENLNKAMIYIITYFYKMFRGDKITAESIPYKRIMNDKIDPMVIEQIVEEVKNNEDNSFMSIIKMIMKINPVRYKDLDATYISYFTQSCGVSLIFALENISYLFLLIASASYKTGVTAYSLNKAVTMPCKKAVVQLSALGDV